ncbi:Fic family protein [Lacticaseibacillus daqingensis]|uniref:filamentation induced by cAMP protein fic n=1 Tax=Lacticaseibacillus daqingensis TaxID=2486014 RepID=UPI000F78B3D4|nr:filamentation induced by cAMP protein fic [Lacticaseibacillus daqingensis]
MEYPDKYHLSQDQNRRLTRSNFDLLVHTTARFEGINTTLPQTRTIMEGLGVNGVSIDDMNTIVQLKRGWDYITKEDQPLSLQIQKNINAIVAKYDALIPGALRTGQGGVDIGAADDYIPPMISEVTEQGFLATMMASQRSTTEKAMRIMYHDMRSQIFWDGNKRSATLSANKVMIDGGAGLINVPLPKWGEWNELISAYYQSGDVGDLLAWTYANAIQGVSL